MHAKQQSQSHEMTREWFERGKRDMKDRTQVEDKENL